VASCTQVKSMLQACIDDELSASERVIVEQHLAQCDACAAVLRRHQQSAAFLFEVLAEHRLGRDLRQSVLDHLPEMDPLRIDVNGVNWREGSPTARRGRLVQVLSVAAAVVLVVLAGVLYVTWPHYPDSPGEAIGVVTYSEGEVKYTPGQGAARILAFVKGIVKCGERYETGPRARLMLTLRGPTNLKMNENTSLRLFDDRRVRVEQGHVWLSVGRDERPFRVETPTSNITVIGTTFDVRVDGETTVVTVHKGRVLVENEVASRELGSGERVSLVGSQGPLLARLVEAAITTRWAELMAPDHEAYALFLREIQPRTVAELQAEQAFVVITKQDGRTRSISSFFFTWLPDPFLSGHCGYDVHIYNDSMMALFSHHIDGSVFANKDEDTYEIQVPGEPIRDANVLHLKVIPDFDAGGIETSFTKVSALGI